MKAWIVTKIVRALMWVTRTEMFYDGGFTVEDFDWDSGRVGFVAIGAK